jgi:hypothetical protein
MKNLQTCFCCAVLCGTTALAFAQVPTVSPAPAPPPPDVRAANPAIPKAAPKNAEEARIVQELERVIVEGVVDPEEARRREKAAIGRMRDSLDKVASKRGLTARESTAADGSRRAELNTVGGLYCLESRAGQIDWSGLGNGLNGGPNKTGTATKPSGNSCP